MRVSKPKPATTSGSSTSASSGSLTPTRRSSKDSRETGRTELSPVFDIRKIKEIGLWADYPIGTRAVVNSNVYWTRTYHGWRQNNGDFFAEPNSNVIFVLLP